LLQFPTDEALFRLLIDYQPYIIAFIMGFARIVAAVTVFPLFSLTNTRGQVRALFAVCLTIPVVPLIHAEIVKLEGLTLMQLGTFIAKEYLFGLIMGVLLAIPFWSVQTAGDIVDFSRNASAANLSDPVNANENSLAGTILVYAALALFVSMNGLQITIGFIYDSYNVFRPTQILPNPDMELVKAIGTLLSRLFTIGIIVSGPIMIALTLTDIALVFASRIARQVPLNDFSVLIKNVIVAAFLPLYAVFLSQYVMTDWQEIARFLRGFLRLDGG
jgi:type III secretion protein T